MGKSTHLSLIDVVSLVKELRSLILDIRLQNVYSINSKTYLFKFYDSKTKRKVSVVAEKGKRRYVVDFQQRHHILTLEQVYECM